MKFSRVEDTVPASVWFQAITPLLREGYQFKICPQGGSMTPFLVGGRDEAVLSAPDVKYKFEKNDIVLYKMANGPHVLHRVCRINRKGVYTLGDGNTEIEGPFKRDEIVAVADYIIRKGKKIDRKNLGYIVLVTVWRRLRPFRSRIIRMYSGLRKKQ